MDEDPDAFLSKANSIIIYRHNFRQNPKDEPNNFNLVFSYFTEHKQHNMLRGERQENTPMKKNLYSHLR